MPVLKKKWIAANNEDNTDAGDSQEVDLVGEEDRELGEDGAATAETKENPRKRPAEGPTTGGLKGLGEVLLEKRKRTVPPAELKLDEWIETNLEQRTDTTIPLVQLYQQFTTVCQMEADAGIMDELMFARIIKKKFGKAFGLKEGSLYKSVKELKEKKIGAAKKKATPGGISLKEAVYEALNFYGNPWAGTRFNSLKQYIGTKYPAFRIDMRQNSLKRTLEVQHYYGKLELVKGIGKCGFYRIPGGSPPVPEEKTKQGSKSSGEEDGEKKEENGEGGEKSEDDKAEPTENGEKKEEEAGGSSPTKASKPKVIKKVSGYSRWPHGDPKKIEDTFPLAICYQSAPKAVGTKVIRKYILDHYNTQIGDKGFKAAVERGEEKGMWENLSGVTSGKLHLLMDDFDPRCDNIEDQICAAIIASHEPKSCSASVIKKYVAQYHPEFKVEEKPQNFKKALIRAVERGICLQLSGLGATGSFQLTYRWSPSPNVLAGEEDASEDEESEVEYDSDDEPVPVYVPKGSKSRGRPKIKDVEMSPSRQKASSKRKAPKSAKGRGRPKKYAEDSDDEDEVPAKKAKGSSAAKGRGRPRKDESPQKGKKSKKRELSPLTDEEEEEEVVEYTPSKSKSRGAEGLKAVKGKGLKVSISPAKGRKPGSGRPAKGAASPAKGAAKGKVVYKDDSDEDQSASEPEEVEEEEYSPVKEKKGGKGKKGKKNADSDEEEALEYTPKKSKSRGGAGTPASAKASKSPAAKGDKKAAKSPAPKAGKKGKGKKKR